MINPIDGTCLVYAGNPKRGSFAENAGGGSPARAESPTPAQNGVSSAPTTEAAKKKLKGIGMWNNMFGDMAKLPDSLIKKPGFITFPPPSIVQKRDSCLELNAIDLKLEENKIIKSQRGHQFPVANPTPRYCIQLVRGQNFCFDLYFYRQVDLSADCLDVYLEKDSTRIPIEIKGINGKRVNSQSDVANDAKRKNNSNKKQQQHVDPNELDVASLQGKLVQQNGQILTLEITLIEKIMGEYNQLWRLHFITSNSNDATSSEFDYFVEGIHVV